MSRSFYLNQMASKSFGSSRKKDRFLYRNLSFFRRYKSRARFSICLADSICANALDMLPCGNEIYIISSFEWNEKHIDFVITKISSNRRLHIDKIQYIHYVHLNHSAFFVLKGETHYTILTNFIIVVS